MGLVAALVCPPLRARPSRSSLLCLVLAQTRGAAAQSGQEQGEHGAARSKEPKQRKGHESQELRGLGPGPAQSLEGPILADFLAMGAGRRHLPAMPAARPEAASLAALRMRPTAAASSSAPAAKAAKAVAPSAEAKHLERRVVEAALRRGEALVDVPLSAPRRTPLPTAPTARVPLPPLFGHGYARYVESHDTKATDGERSTAESEASAAPPEPSADAGPARRSLRLRVQPRHREALRKMLCRALIAIFTQYRKEVQGLRPDQPLLSRFESEDVQEHVKEGYVARLIKHLAVTELHMCEGPLRSGRVIGGTMGAEEVKVLRKERQQFTQSMDITEGDVKEGQVARLFLDGCLSWPRVRELLGLPAESPKKSPKKSR